MSNNLIVSLLSGSCSPAFLQCTDSPLCLSSTCVTIDLRKAFDEAFEKEVALQNYTSCMPRPRDAAPMVRWRCILWLSRIVVALI